MKDYRFLQRKYLLATYPDRGLTFVKGKGCFLYDQNQRRFLDLMSNYGVSIFGYNFSAINQVVKQQLTRLWSLHSSFSDDIRAQASMEIIRKVGLNQTKVYWSNSGAESVEAALKFAMIATGKSKFLAFKAGFHGKTRGALSVTDNPRYRQAIAPFGIETVFVDYNDLPAVEEVLDNGFAAVMVEPIQGEGGVRLPDKDFLSKLSLLTKKHKVLLIVDEIQTGTGRTGRFLNLHWYKKIQPDIICLGKGLAAGLPIGATLVTDQVADVIPRLSHTSTFGGNPLVLSACRQVLALLDDAFLEEINQKGIYFLDKLRHLRSPIVKQIRGWGLMIGIQLKSNRNLVLRRLQEEAILAIPAGSDVVRFLPPYIITKQEIDMAVTKIAKVLNLFGD